MIYKTSTNESVEIYKLKHKHLKEILFLIDDHTGGNLSIKELIPEVIKKFNGLYSQCNVYNPDLINIVKLIVMTSFDYSISKTINCDCGNQINSNIKYKLVDTGRNSTLKDISGDIDVIEHEHIKQYNDKVTNEILNSIYFKPSVEGFICRVCGKSHEIKGSFTTYVDIINFILSQYSIKYLYEYEMYMRKYGNFSLMEIYDMYLFEHRVYKHLMEKQYAKNNS